MKRFTRILLGVSLLAAFLFAGAIVWAAGEVAEEYKAGITIEVDGEQYYFAGPVVGSNGEKDVPGHEWRIEGSNQILGKHYKTGHKGASKWWSSDAEDGELLYTVEAVIDTWDIDKAFNYALKGFVHYHELVKVTDGTLNPTKVVWLKHIAESDFTLDGGPRSDLSHKVMEGLDEEFMNNFFMPYTAEKEYVKGIAVEVDGEEYYFSGPPVGPNGELDVPGHDWVQVSENLVYGRHFNTGPMDKAKWWSSDAPDGALLFTVIGIIDTWIESKAEEYASRGFIHYHEFVNTVTGEQNAMKVVWLKHAAVGEFNFDGGPVPELGHMVSRGIDLKFMPNYKKPYKG
jgi:hypothetical protein